MLEMGLVVVGPRTLTTETWRLFRTVVADSHHFDEEQDPGPDPYCS